MNRKDVFALKFLLGVSKYSKNYSLSSTYIINNKEYFLKIMRFWWLSNIVFFDLNSEDSDIPIKYRNVIILKWQELKVRNRCAKINM